MNIGENLIKIRKKANLKQEEMASLINVSPKTISSWENNRNLPSIEMIILIANTLNIKIDDIISDKKEASNLYLKKEQQRNTFVFLIILILPLIFSIVSAYDALNIQTTIDNKLQILSHFIVGNKNNFILYILTQIINYFLFIFKKNKGLLIFSIIEFLLLIFSLLTLNLIYTPTIILTSLTTTLICFITMKKSN